MDAETPAPIHPLVIGDALIDELRYVSETGAVESTESVGGAALNVAVGLSRLGFPATLLAMVGDDEAGSRIRETLATHGTALLASPSPHGTSRAISVRNAGGEPSYEFNRAAQQRQIDFSGDFGRAVRAADAVITSCFPFDHRAQSQALLEVVTDHPGLYVVDPNARPTIIHDQRAFTEEFERHAAHADIVKLSDEDAAFMYGMSATQAMSRALALGASAVLATHGSGGATLRTIDRDIHVPIVTLPGPIVDTMGAGDATVATFTSEFLRANVPVREALSDADMLLRALEAAMANAAATCRAPGALLRTP